MTRFLRWFAWSLLLGVLGLALGAPAGPSDAPPAFAPSLAKAVIFATNSVRIGPGVEILSGDILVNTAQPRETLDAGVERSLERGATILPPDALVVADRLQVQRGAVIRGTAVYNQAQGPWPPRSPPCPGAFPCLRRGNFRPFRR